MFRIDNPNHKHVWGVQTLLLGNNLQDSLGSWRSIPSSRVITQCLVLILGIVPVSLTDLTDAEYIYRRVTCTLGHRSSTRSMCLTNLCFIASFKYDFNCSGASRGPTICTWILHLGTWHDTILQYTFCPMLDYDLYPPANLERDSWPCPFPVDQSWYT